MISKKESNSSEVEENNLSKEYDKNFISENDPVVINDTKKKNQDIIKYSAGGLRDFTRIASSDPIMWRDIFIDNSENIIKILDKFSRNIEDFKKAVSEKNGDKLLKVFSTTKNVRKEIIKAGQDVKSPDFGRKKS